MKKSKLIYTVIAAALLAGAIGASAQSDSSNVPPLRGNPIVRLTLQERETPVVNNITQVTQVVQPNTYTNLGAGAGGYAGTWLATSYAYCNAGSTVISGGGTCTNGTNSFGRAKDSYPIGGGWVYQCGADENGSDGTIFATARVVCSN